MGVAPAVCACSFTHGSLGTVRDDASRGDGSEELIDGPPAEGISSDVELVIEAESYTTNVTRGTHIWMLAIDVAGYRGTSAMRLLPDDGAPCISQVEAVCSELQYSVVIPRDGTYRVFVRIRSTGAGDDSLWYGFDGVAEPVAITPMGVYNAWIWRDANQTFTLSAGAHVLGVWYRETGIRLDQVAVSTKTTAPP